MKGLKTGFLMGFGEAIPWTDFLADIATKGPSLHLVFELYRNLAAQFDGQIGDALGGIQTVGLQGLGGSGVNASRALPAMVLNGHIRYKIKIAENFRQEEIASCLFL
ncbi:MAG: hypothetical protein RLZZ617_1093 [Bacteroidota bacterium]